jgi:hypothetical protein
VLRGGIRGFDRSGPTDDGVDGRHQFGDVERLDEDAVAAVPIGVGPGLLQEVRLGRGEDDREAARGGRIGCPLVAS